jgi:hypothetical protein
VNTFGTYLRYIGLLLSPGSTAPVFNSAQADPGEMTGWSDDELQLMVVEGRRELDALDTQLTEIRGRAQAVLTTAIALAGVLAGIAGTAHHRCGSFAVWILGVAGIVLSALGSAAIITVKAYMSTIHTAVLSRYEPPVLERIARDYAGMTRQGQNTVATRLTLLWLAVLLLLVGGALGFASWITAKYW